MLYFLKILSRYKRRAHLLKMGSLFSTFSDLNHNINIFYIFYISISLYLYQSQSDSDSDSDTVHNR